MWVLVFFMNGSPFTAEPFPTEAGCQEVLVELEADAELEEWAEVYTFDCIFIEED